MSRRSAVRWAILIAVSAAIGIGLGPGRAARSPLALPLAVTAADDSVAAAAADSEPAGGAVSEPSGPPPEIPFSHVLHAGKHGIDCLFCHGQAAHGAEANIPSARDCYVCHWAIASDKPAILELERRVHAGTPVLWPASVRLPQHVQFQHEPHIRQGVECAACHGNLGRRENAQPSRTLTMGFCVECHRTEGATHDCMACHQ